LIAKLDLKIPLSDPVKRIGKLQNGAGLGEITKPQAINIVYEVIKKEISARKDPMGLTASYFIYQASTLRKRCMQLKSKL
jgi:hypothetical protein